MRDSRVHLPALLIRNVEKRFEMDFGGAYHMRGHAAGVVQHVQRQEDGEEGVEERGVKHVQGDRVDITHDINTCAGAELWGHLF